MPRHLLTQLFFDNMHFYRFLNLARRAGITLPVSAGVMPIVKRSQIERTVSLSSASLPSEFTRMISRYQDDPASLYDAGIDYAVRQLRDLLRGGADGIHLYAMNDAAVAAKVYDGIRGSAVMERRKPAAIDRATALRYMGASGWTPDAATAVLLDKAEQTVLTAAAPRSVYRRLPRTALPLENCGSDLTRHLQGCDEVLLLAATRLEAEVDKLFALHGTD